MSPWRSWVRALFPVLLASCTAHDNSANSDNAATSVAPASELLDNAQGANEPLRAVGRLRSQMSCTAVFLDFGGSQDAPAYVLTNGHCAQDWGPATSATDVLRGIEPGSDATVTFDYFHDTQDRQTSIRIKAVPYSTMKARDVAVVLLDSTRGALEAKGIHPLKLAPAPPAAGDTISIIHAPLMDVPFLRRSSCTEAGRTTVVERNWLWPNVHRNACADVRPGSSGSPVLDRDGHVFALTNTTTLGAKADGACWLGAPCEVDHGDEDTFAPDTNYAIALDGLSACFDDAGSFALEHSGCPLDRGAQPAVTGSSPYRVRPVDVQGKPVTWNVRVEASDTFTHLRTKVGPVRTTSCQSLDGYGAASAIATTDLASTPVPETEGPMVMCVLAGPSAEDTAWMSPTTALSFVTVIDTTPPSREAKLHVDSFPPNAQVEPLFELPELAGFFYAVAPASVTDCSDPSLKWKTYFRIPIEMDLTEPRPRLCLRAEDFASNVGPAHLYDIAPP